MTSKLTLCSWNVNGLGNKRGAGIGERGVRDGCISLTAWLDINSPSILAFQETLTKGNTAFKTTQGEYLEFHEPCDGFPHRSLSFAVHETVQSQITKSGKIGLDSLFAQYITLNTESNNLITIVNVYIPSGKLNRGSELHRSVKIFYNKLRIFVETAVSSGEMIVVFGDFNTKNARFGGNDDSDLIKLDLEKNFQDLCLLESMELPGPTWRRGNRSSYLDHVMVSRKDSTVSIHLGECLNGVGPRQYPDHRPVFVTQTRQLKTFLWAL